MTQPMRMHIEHDLIDILREYKSMLGSVKGHWQLAKILNHSHDNIDSLIQKLGLCYGEFAPFKLYVHPSSDYSAENIAKYIKAMQTECDHPEGHKCLDE
jgi:hypothetical protein